MATDVTACAAWLHDFADVIEANIALLTDLDRAIGDADHGLNMSRGMKAVAAIDASGYADASAYLRKAGMTLVSTVGGAAGPLFGTLMLRLAENWPADGSAAGLGDALQAGVDGVRARGRSGVGDKTMVDALVPAVDAYRLAQGQGIGPALNAAATAAARGRDLTIPLIAHKGRASYLGDRSIGHQDPGATSAALLLDSAARHLS